MRSPKLLTGVIFAFLLFLTVRLFAQMDEWDITPFRPYDITVTPEGIPVLTYIDVTIADSGKVLVFDPITETSIVYTAPFQARFHSIDYAAPGHIWLGDCYHRIVHFNLTTGTFTAYEMPDWMYRGEDPEEFVGLTASSDGRIWFTLWSNKTINVLDPFTFSWDQYPLETVGEFVPGVPVELTFDREGDVWFTMRQWGEGYGGVGQLELLSSEITLYLDPDLYDASCFPYGGKPLTPWDIKYVDGMIWFVDHSSSCLVKLNPSFPETSIECISMPDDDERPWDAHYFDVDRQGKFWMTAFGVSKLGKFDPETETFESYDLADGMAPMGIAVSSREHLLSRAGHIWFAETNTPGQGGLGRYRTQIRTADPRWIPDNPFHDRLFLVDCGPCPACFAGPCDPRVNPDFDRFIIWDPRRDDVVSFSMKEIGLDPMKDGPLAAAAPMVNRNGQLSFVVAAPNAHKTAGSILFLNQKGDVIQRINGKESGDFLGTNMDVRKNLLVVASSRELMKFKDHKLLDRITLTKSWNAKLGMHLAFTDDVDADGLPEVLLGLPYATISNFKNAGQIVLLNSAAGQVHNIAQGRSKNENVGMIIYPMNLEIEQYNKIIK